MINKKRLCIILSIVMCFPINSHLQASSQNDEEKLDRNLTRNILFGAGVVAVGVGAYWFLKQLNKEDLSETAHSCCGSFKLSDGEKSQKEVKIEELIYNYKSCSISDFKIRKSGRHYSEVLEEIGEDLAKHKAVGQNLPISLIFAENYLQDEGVENICKFILETPFLKSNLVSLDLSNNRFTKKSLPSLYRLLEEMGQIKYLDISVNYIDFNAYNACFSKADQRSKVKFSQF